jgi:hypothetical protein
VVYRRSKEPHHCVIVAGKLRQDVDDLLLQAGRKGRKRRNEFLHDLLRVHDEVHPPQLAQYELGHVPVHHLCVQHGRELGQLDQQQASAPALRPSH